MSVELSRREALAVELLHGDSEAENRLALEMLDGLSSLGDGLSGQIVCTCATRALAALLVLCTNEAVTADKMRDVAGMLAAAAHAVYARRTGGMSAGTVLQ